MQYKIRRPVVLADGPEGGPSHAILSDLSSGPSVRRLLVRPVATAYDATSQCQSEHSIRMPSARLCTVNTTFSCTSLWQRARYN